MSAVMFMLVEHAKVQMMRKISGFPAQLYQKRSIGTIGFPTLDSSPISKTDYFLAAQRLPPNRLF